MTGAGRRASIRTTSVISPTRASDIAGEEVPMDEMVKDRRAATATPTQLIAGVSGPESTLITAAIEYARRISEPYLFNHAMRSWLFAEAIGRTKGFDYDREVVAIGTILHDIGLTAAVAGAYRFE